MVNIQRRFVDGTSDGVTIGGSVVITPTSGLTSFSAENIGAIGADLYIGGSGVSGGVVFRTRGSIDQIEVEGTMLSSLTFQYLSHANRISVSGNSALASASFPSLERVDGRVDIENNAALSVLAFNVLMDVIGVLRIKNNAALPAGRPAQICDALAPPKMCDI